ncbi:MAG: protein-(glutamine-N5) methyltransferase, release factor-specific [Chloroflexi bacterium RBG_16_52_11]|nr:MAG: protein-(glutamine-N5) methyltransferase, release factor-specific [Chloroflexi bacterium RBG_16_52_11]
MEIAYQISAPLSDTARLDAQVLVAHVLEKPRPWVLAHLEVVVTPAEAHRLHGLLDRLAQGEPLPYLLGRWEFYGLEFLLTPAVLIPRPETELLVEHALAWLGSRPATLLAADVGTGSGCIAISLAVHTPWLKVIASDISLPALRVAQANAVRHQVARRVHCVQADLLPETDRAFDLVCANLPYIPFGKLEMLKVYRQEPSLALNGGFDGLSPIRRLLHNLDGRIAAGGLLLMEIESTLGDTAISLVYDAFPRAEIELLQDHAGQDRLLRVVFQSQ